MSVDQLQRRLLPRSVFDVCAALAFPWAAISTPPARLARWLGLLSTPAVPECDMTGQVVIVTGSNTGCGKRTAYHLARMGATVVLACRSQERADAARADIIREVAARCGGADCSARVSVLLVDLSDTASVRAFARAFRARHARLHVLVNNAGLSHGSGVTRQGLCLTFAANMVGHFLLTQLLMEPLLAAAAAGWPCRVVNLSSVSHHFAGTDWREAALGRSRSHWWRIESPYADSKLAMVLFSQELRRRFELAGAANATSYAVNPGAVASDVYRFLPRLLTPLLAVVSRLFFLDTDRGAFTSVFAAAAPLPALGGPAGPLYWEPYWLPLGLAHPFEIMGPFVGAVAAPPALPPDARVEGARLWEACEELVRVAERADAPR